MSTYLDMITAKRKEVYDQAEAILHTAETAKRGLTATEQAKFNELGAHMDGIAEQIKAIEAQERSNRETDDILRSVLGGNGSGGNQYGTITRQAATEPTWTREDGRQASVTRGQRFSDHEVVRSMADRVSKNEAAVLDAHGGIGNLLRATTTTSGSALVPTLWAGSIIDRARNYSAVLAAGAELIPMESKVLQIGRLTGDPTAAFRAESSTITASDPTFDNVTLTSNTLSCLVVGSREWFEDGNDVDQVVNEAIAKAVALEIDLNALYGGVTAGSEIGVTGFNRTLTAPPSPRGVLAALLATASSNVLGGAINGTSQTAAAPWQEIIDLVGTLADQNEHANGVIWSSRLERRYASLVDTLYQPLRRPDYLDAIPFHVSNQIPSNLTVGTSTTNMSDVFAGDWTQLLIGQRLNFQVQTLSERYAELGQIGILATWRGDVQPARPKAFAVHRYLRNT